MVKYTTRKAPGALKPADVLNHGDEPKNIPAGPAFVE
jgi:hypothetical protein